NGQLGFNNPDQTIYQFSLRNELYRLSTNANATASDKVWHQVLEQSVVNDIFALPEFQLYCAPPGGVTAPQPGIVITFPTTIQAGLNYFGWPLGGGDSSFNPTAYATKIRAAGVTFTHYPSSLPCTPYVYLIPVGNDVFRAPGGGGATREFKVVDQALPIPTL